VPQTKKGKCSSCEKDAASVSHLFVSNYSSVCNECVSLAAMRLAQEFADPTRVPQVPAKLERSSACSFCTKFIRGPQAVVSLGDFRICADCIQTCFDEMLKDDSQN
jgi:hypothetical protein